MSETPSLVSADRKLRITCAMGPFLPVPPLLGGAVERIWYALAQEFAARGHVVTMISRRFPGLANDERDRHGIRQLRIPSRDALPIGLRYRLADLAYAWRVARLMPASDVTVTNSVALPLLLRRRVAGVIYTSVARFPKAQIALYGRVDRLQAVSRAVAEAITARFPRLAARVKVVPNALSAKFVAHAPTPAEGKERQILFVGRIAPEKGLELLVAAFAASGVARSGWRLTLLGPADHAAGGGGDGYLDRLRRAAGDDVEFANPIYEEGDLIATMERAAVFAYPSLAEHGESFGMAPLEAMACGAAVVLSDLACFRDFADAKANCVIFDHRRDATANLASALVRLCADPPLRGRLGAAGRATAQRFAPARVAELFLADFATLADVG